jgi:hypothetical protein
MPFAAVTASGHELRITKACAATSDVSNNMVDSEILPAEPLAAPGAIVLFLGIPNDPSLFGAEGPFFILTFEK